MNLWVPITRAEAAKKYGAVINGSWAGAMANCTLFRVDPEISPFLINTATKKPTVNIYVNKDMVDPLAQAFANIKYRGLMSELKSFDGCFMQRDVRGEAGVVSWHAWAMAIDINAKDNALGAVPMISSAMVSCFRDAGFVWGGNFSRLDGMHFQLGLD